MNLRSRQRFVGVAIGLAYAACSAITLWAASPKRDAALRALPYYPIPERATFLYTEGLLNRLMQGDPHRSALLFDAARQLDSTHLATLYELGNLLAPKPEIAIPYARKALEVDSTNCWVLDQLGRLYLQQQAYGDALKVYDKLLRIAPDRPESYLRMAALYESQGQPFSAISMLDSAERKFGVTEQASAYKRQLLVGVKLYNKALSEAKVMTENFPYDPANFVALAELYATMGRDSLALKAYQQAQELSPKNTATLVSLNNYYKQKGNDEKFLLTAAQLFEDENIPLETKISFFKEITASREFYQARFLQISNLISALALKHPEDFGVTQLYAQHLIASGNLDGALQLYKARLNDSLPKREAFIQVLDIESYLQHPDSVAKYAALALDLFPKDLELYLRQAAGLAYNFKDHAGAEKEYLKALKLAPNDSVRSVIYTLLGDNRQQMDKEANCASFYKKGLKYDPDNAMLLNNYSYYLSVAEKQLPRADRLSARALERSPNEATYLDTRAWVLYKMGRYEEARTVIKQAIAFASNRSNGMQELHLHYGDILYALGDEFMAVFYWKKAKENGYDATEIDKRLKLVENR